MEIRQATIDDSCELSQVFSQVWKKTYKNILPIQFLENLSDTTWVKSFQYMFQKQLTIVYVAMIDNHIVGGIIIDEQQGRIIALNVLPHYQRSGIGKALIQQGIIDLKIHQEIYLHVIKQNKLARRFYEAMGFTNTYRIAVSSIANLEIEEYVYVINRRNKMTQTLEYLQQLLSIASPTGYTKEIQNYLVKTLQQLGYQPQVTNKGSVVVTVIGENDDKHRIVTAHVDTLGAIVRAIKPDGRLKMDKIGGFPWNMIEGENCTVHIASNEQTITGTILVHQTSCHVYPNAGTVERTQDNMEVRLDTIKNPRDLGIDIGDFISFDPRTIITNDGFIKSRFLDDKVSAAILLELLRIYQQDRVLLPVTTQFIFSVFEEVGHGGNSSLTSKAVEYLAVDMGAIGDDQQTDEYTVSICVKDASGPYHYDLRQHLVKLAQQHHIDYKLDIYPYYGSDASGAMRAGAEVKHGLLGAGIESSHSYERTHISSVKATEKLVDVYLRSDLVQ